MSPRASAAVRADRLAARCAAAATEAPPSTVPLSDVECDACGLRLPVLEVQLGSTTHASCVRDHDDDVTTSTRRTNR